MEHSSSIGSSLFVFSFVVIFTLLAFLVVKRIFARSLDLDGPPTLLGSMVRYVSTIYSYQ